MLFHSMEQLQPFRKTREPAGTPGWTQTFKSMLGAQRAHQINME